MQHIPLSISEGVVLEAQDKTTYHHALLAQHGFTHIHFARNWRAEDPVSDAEVAQLQENLQRAKIRVLDVHGPHPHAFDVGVENAENRQVALERVQHCLHLTKQLGGDAMVYHVPTKEYDAAALDRYVDGLKRVEELARSLGIAIALENHYRADVDRQTFTKCFEKFEPDYIGFTFDTGHACMSGNTQWILDNCMERLKVLHLNDNDGKRDLHWLPLSKEGAVDWNAIAGGIAKSPYDKPLQMEVSYERQQQYQTREEFLSAAAAAGQELHRRIATLRQNKED